MLKTEVLGKQNSTKVIVALVMSLIVVVPHILGKYPDSHNPVLIMNKMMGGFALFVIGILIAIMVLMFVMKDPKKAIMNFDYAYVFPIILLVYISQAIPHLFGFLLAASVIALLISFLLGMKTKITFYFTIVMVGLIIIDWAFGWPRQLPIFLQFLEDDVFQTISIVVLVFMLIISAIIGKKEEA